MTPPDKLRGLRCILLNYIYIEIEPIRSHRPDVYIYLPLLHVRGKCCAFRNRSGNKSRWRLEVPGNGPVLYPDRELQPEIAGSQLPSSESR